MMTCVTPEPKNLDETSEMNGSHTDPISYMQSFNNVAMRHIFSYLNIKDLEVASRVCTSWNSVSKDNILWRHVQLKETMVYDWDKFIDIIIEKGSTTLGSRGMLMPSELQDFENFWTNFISATKRATQLHKLELYKCLIDVFHECIIALPHLSVFNAYLIINPNIRIIHGRGVNVYISISSISRMVNLTELRLKALPGITLEPSTLFTFENLTKLRTLSLISIKSFPKNLCQSLEPVTTSLEHLEIGDCKSIIDGLPILIKRFTNLKILRLVNCRCMEDDFAKELFVVIRSLTKLKILELVNIIVNNCIEEELGKFTGLDSLLIIPMYMTRSVMSHRYMIICLKKLSKTLKYLVWVLTQESLHGLDIYKAVLQKNQSGIPCNINMSRQFMINVFRFVQSENQAYEEDDVDLLSAPVLQNLLEEIMVNGKFKVITVPYSETNEVYIQEHFKEIRYI